VFPAITESIEEKYDFDVVQVDWSHVHESSVHGDNFISTIAKGEVRVIAEVKSLFQQDQLCLGTKLFVTAEAWHQLGRLVECNGERDVSAKSLGQAQL
jgi:hypothetical protein